MQTTGMASAARAERRRAARAAARPREIPLCKEYVIQGHLDPPQPGEKPHVSLALAVGRDSDEQPLAALQLCSHTLDQFCSDLRLAVKRAEREGESYIGPGGETITPSEPANT